MEKNTRPSIEQPKGKSKKIHQLRKLLKISTKTRVENSRLSKWTHKGEFHSIFKNEFTNREDSLL